MFQGKPSCLAGKMVGNSPQETTESKPCYARCKGRQKDQELNEPVYDCIPDLSFDSF